MKRRSVKTLLIFIITAVLLFVVIFIAINTGGIYVSISQLFKGLFIEYDKDVAIIFQIRFPRIAVAFLGGALMSVSGVLMQAVMRNPLADPGIVGVTSGAATAAVVVSSFFPAMAYLTPLFSFVGGLTAFLIVYLLAMGGDSSPTKLILTGIAVNAVFTGLYQAFQSAAGAVYSGAANIVNANISLKEWSDVRIMLIYFSVAVLLSVISASSCNLLTLSDKTLTGIGVNVKRIRFILSIISVLMASIFTAVIGSVSFLGLVVPHIARLLVGSDHKKLIPYSALFGAVLFLAADTLGRAAFYPYEISPAVIMSIIGGPVFICLLKGNRSSYGK